MATKHQYDYARRACTEVPERGDACEPFDINALPDMIDKNAAEDLDDIDFGNYKGIYANDENG
jgi:hypothetical protein